jgi:nitrogen fixation protein FixH
MTTRSLTTTLPTAPAGRRLTGRHVLVMFLAFFGVVVTVNATMLTLALDTMPGTTTDSAYRASQRFNANLAAARMRAARGWMVDAHVRRDPSGAAALTVGLAQSDGVSIDGVAISARLMHPLHRTKDHAFDIARLAAGRFAGTADGVGPGSYDLVVLVERNGEMLYRSRNRIMLP